MGTNHSGPCRSSTCSSSPSPLSAGFSMMNCVPVPCAAPSMYAMRRTMRLARRSSRACAGGGEGSPSMSSRVRTTGGPPSREAGECMKREIEKVLHGGAAMIARNSPFVARSSSARYTSSKSISPLVPPPCCASLSTQVTVKPRWRRRAASPSCLSYGPENSKRMCRDELARPFDPRTAVSNASMRDSAAGRGGGGVGCCGGGAGAPDGGGTAPGGRERAWGGAAG